MSEVFTEMVEVLDNASNVTITLDGNSGDISAGGNGQDGDFIIKNAAGEEIFRINGNEGDITIWRKIGGVQRQVMRFDASHAALYLGCEGNEGDIIIRNNAGDETFRVDGDQGDIIVRRRIGGTQRQVMKFDASHAALYVGCQGNEGDIFVRDGGGRDVFHFDSNYAALYIGANGNEGDVIVRDGTGTERIRLDGHSGDIQLHGADCAEEFQVSGPDTIDPGTVLVINDEGDLHPCAEAYDKKVAGVVSGGNGNNPGIVLGKTPTSNRRLPISLNGRVYCKVDADSAPIEVGDLLTTSSTPGHAMKANDPTRAFGAVIGKALRPLDAGRGEIPILVALQ